MVGGWAMPVKHTYDAAASKSSKYSETVPDTVYRVQYLAPILGSPHAACSVQGGFKIFRGTRLDPILGYPHGALMAQGTATLPFKKVGHVPIPSPYFLHMVAGLLSTLTSILKGKINFW